MYQIIGSGKLSKSNHLASLHFSGSIIFIFPQIILAKQPPVNRCFFIPFSSLISSANIWGHINSISTSNSSFISLFIVSSKVSPNSIAPPGCAQNQPPPH